LKNDFRKALKTVWGVYSVAGLLLILITLCLPDAFILKATPVCYSIKRFGKECFMCGSTRSFIQFARGNFENAIALNKFAFILYTLLIINSVFFISFLLKTKNKKT